MGVNEAFAADIRKLLKGRGRIEEKSMFGGLTFMLDGKMCCGVNGDGGKRLLVRVDPARVPELLKRRGARPMDFTGRVMKGYLWVEAPGTATPKALKEWVEESAGYVVNLKAARK